MEVITLFRFTCVHMQCIILLRLHICSYYSIPMQSTSATKHHHIIIFIAEHTTPTNGGTSPFHDDRALLMELYI